MKSISTLVVLITSVVFAQPKPVSSVPMTVEKNVVYIYCKVNETDSLKFLFDTGADGSVINEESLGKLKLKIDGGSRNVGSNGSNEVKSSSGNTLSIGTLKKANVRLTVIPYGTDGFDGVLGTDVMKGNIIEVNYGKNIINFYSEADAKALDYSGYHKMKLSTDGYPTCVKSEIVTDAGKYSGLFGVDTGADDALTMASPFVKRHDLEKKMPNIGSAGFQGSDGTNYSMPIVLCPEIAFAGKRLYRVPVALSSAKEGIDASEKFAGFYGNAFLKKFNVILDYNGGNIYFRLNKNLYTEYYD